MKKAVLSLLILIACVCSLAGIAKADTYFVVTTITLTNANQDYTWSCPARALNINIQTRTPVDIKISNASISGGNTYFTIRSGTSYSAQQIWSNDNIMYISSATAGTVVEIGYWQST